ncbi:PAS domain S-box protein [Mesorhizobium humile]|uniref:histidine kinase n=1 Tax=Mesorhizobium humile TaxID=3072313 RepID=A0ABU4YNT6_9HYPH|nr:MULTISPECIES: PAS domain S-box protein [unclassified Mesorhizobium]MDX8463105.1 PAS domain S-box protein [Mesorhizobium sp. VK2D]MDX8488478.1 PAS domain S-box protein [Mesorhizobium sp. VK2B]
MPPENYSFLDVAVLDAVRQRFAAGDALAILSVDLEQVIWANGPGASAFGYPDIEAIIGASARLPLIARRQIMATSGFPDIGSDRAITVRLATGMVSRAVGFLASAVTMPDGEKAILLALPAAQTSSRSAGEIASRAIGGFTETGHFIAFVDAQGDVEAASDGFAALGIEPRTLAALVADVASSGDRVVKRLVPGTNTSYPAGFAQLTDTRHLLVVIDENQLDDSDGGQDDRPAAELDDQAGDQQGAAPEAVVATPPGESPVAPAPQSAPDNPVPVVAAGEEAEPVQEAPDGDAPPDAETLADQQPTRTEHQANAADSSRQAADAGAGQHDHWYFNAGNEDAAHAQPAAPVKGVPEGEATAEGQDGRDVAARETTTSAQPAPPRDIDRSAPPLRFVWRTDAEGRFSALSPEFADIVGQPAADVIGRRFRDVAATFGLDASGEIAGLLDRRDTWSGRSVLWPVAGTRLKIPVDLAALPVYGRSRAFEGFRGFGVARSADAVVDPEALGMALVPNAAPAGAEPPAEQPRSEQTAPEQPTSEDPFQGEVPALTIVPKPERRFADKVIRLAEHRQPANDKQPGSDTPANQRSLSILERSAFREIGERLRKDSATPAEERAAEADKQPDAAEHDGSVREASPASAAQAPEADDAKADAEAVEAETEAEGQEDLARLDGIDDAPETADTGQAETSAVSGSLLSYADGEEPTEEAGIAAVSESEQAEGARQAAEPVATEPQQPVEQPAAGPVAATQSAPGGTADDDDMTADDFRDAQDNEDWAGSDADAAAAAEEQPEEAPARPRLDVPPLKLSGFVPSALSTGEEAKAPDTSILARLPVPLLIHSGDVLHYANEAFLELTGYDAVDDLADAGGLGALFADPYAEDTATDESDHSLKLKTRNGQEFPIDALLRSVPWLGGKALMLVVRRSGEDDGAHFTAANDEPALQPDVPELKSRIAEMRTIIDTATDGVVLIGRDGNIRSISRPAEALFGFDSDEVAGKPFASLFAIESQRAARDYLAGLSEPGVASVLNDGREVIGREAQGRFIPLFMTIGRLPNDSGFCAVVRDITQWKRAEEDLTQARAVAERASSQKTDFLARISHEIRTPLNAIIGFSELMVDEKFGPITNDRYRDYLRDINRSGNHVLDLVNDLLDISKIEAGQQEMDYEAVSLNDTLAETVAMMQPQANRERVIIRSSFASRLPEVVADLRSVRQIALNILSNAIRYTQAGGQVIVSTAYEASGDVVMRVRDTGIGMTPAEIEQALKPFKQINALKRGRGDGTGLGLPLTKAMVEANRARFAITSTPGEGTLVEVAFPSTRVLAE